MFVRFGVVAAVLATFILLGTPWNGPTLTLQPTAAAAAPADAPAGTWTSGLQFSTSVDSNARPVNPRVQFGAGTEQVWVSFEYHDHNKNADVSYLVRANGEDYRYGDLDCCKGDGRYAFAITKRNGSGNLPGASYDVRVYVNGAEVGRGGFGVNGRNGLDNDGQGNSNGNTNDNHDGNDND